MAVWSWNVCTILGLLACAGYVSGECQTVEEGLCPGSANCMCAFSACSTTKNFTLPPIKIWPLATINACEARLGRCKEVVHDACQGPSNCLKTGLPCGHTPTPGPAPGPTPGPRPPPPSGCTAKLTITAAELRCVFPQLPSIKAAEFVIPLNEAMGGLSHGGLRTRCDWACFLGNVGTESDGLTEWTQRPCADTYCGRGPLQITGKTNYDFCAKESYCKCSNIASDPSKAASDVTEGMGTAACVWASLSGHNLDEQCNGSLEGFKRTAAYINCGNPDCTPNGWGSRQQYWHKANSCF